MNKIGPYEYNSKPTKEMSDQMNDFRESCMRLQSSIDTMVPDSRYKSLASTHLEQCAMWMNKAITH